MMKRRFLCVVITIVFLLQSICYAEISFERDAASNRYKVSGTADFATDYTVSCLVGQADMPIYLKTNFTDDKFGYEFEFGLGDNVQSGEYTVKISARTIGEAMKKTVMLYSNSDVNTAIEEVVGATSKEQLTEILESNYYILGLDSLRKYEISENSDTIIVGELFGNVSDKETFYDIYTENYIVCAVNDAQKEKIGEILDTYEDYLGLTSEEIYSVFESVSGKEAVYESMTEYAMNDIDGIKTAFAESVLLSVMSESVYYGKIMETLEKYEKYFPFSLDAYKKSSKKVSIAKALTGKADAYTTMKIFETKLAEAIENSGKDNTSGGGGGGGGSSGGGNSSGGSSTPSGSTIIAEVVEEENKNDFSDMQGYEWAKPAVEYLKNVGVISGYDDNTFRPGNKVTREEFVKIIVSAFGYYDKEAVCNFVDVYESSWAYKYIASAFENGIVNGISEKEFGYGNYLSRQDMAVIIYNAMKLSETSAEKFYDDANISAYAKSAVYSLKNEGIINGYENRYNPLETATRAEVAKIVYECLSRGDK